MKRSQFAFTNSVVSGLWIALIGTVLTTPSRIEAWSVRVTAPVQNSPLSLSHYRLQRLNGAPTVILHAHSHKKIDESDDYTSKRPDAVKSLRDTTASIALCSTMLFGLLNFPVSSAFASTYESDYVSDTVRGAIQSIKDATGKPDALVKAYEGIAEIITEGKGVGGSINFQGVQLDRGYVSDEDTTIYNPGLTLLTETEKNRLVDAIVQSKQQVISNPNQWNEDTEAGYSFLRDRLDPLHMYELRGYLSIVPFYGAAMYLIALAVQQLARDVFPIAYIVCAAAVFLPAIALVLLGS